MVAAGAGEEADRYGRWVGATHEADQSAQGSWPEAPSDPASRSPDPLDAPEPLDLSAEPLAREADVIGSGTMLGITEPLSSCSTSSEASRQCSS